MISWILAQLVQQALFGIRCERVLGDLQEDRPTDKRMYPHSQAPKVVSQHLQQVQALLAKKKEKL